MTKVGETFGSFKLINKVKSAEGHVSLCKYKSLKTGLLVTIADVLGPLVQGFFTVATEAQSDDGLPHTLEHLVFLGSEDYPYKGVLDLLANRCFADGTNAWTSTDHTSYTVMTAGKFGFLNLLPIYLDHLLYPTLNDSAFTTEVYHITEEGEDAGVVYSEMQAVENEGFSVVYREVLKALYPRPCGYRYETGGIMENLRESTTNEKVRAYHGSLYRPENLHLIITGQIKADEVFEALRNAEDKMADPSRLPKDPPSFARPWQSEVPPFDAPISRDVIYPSDEEDTGIVCIGWRGPSMVSEFHECQSLEALLEYLTETSVAPIPKVVVDVEDPLACKVEVEILNYSSSGILMTFSGTPKDKIPEVEAVVMDTLTKVSLGQLELDMPLMGDTLRKIMTKRLNVIETSPHSFVAGCAIQDFLYGKSDDYLAKIVNQNSVFEALLSQSASYWIALVDKYLIKAPRAVIRGVPSAARAEHLQEEERKRVKDRQERLGEEALKEFGRTLEDAKKANEVKPPPSMLEAMPMPSSTSFGVSFHSLETHMNITHCETFGASPVDASIFDLGVVPFRMHLNDVKSNFVQMMAVLHTRDLSQEQRLYLPLLLDLLLESPMIRGGRRLSHDEVVKELNADTVEAETTTDLSLCPSSSDDCGGRFGEFFHFVGVNLKTELSKYGVGVRWLRDILTGVHFTAERASVKATKILNSIGDAKRSGDAVVTLVSNQVTFKEEAAINTTNFLRQEKFLTRLVARLKSNPEEVVEELEKVYRSITAKNYVTIHLAADLRKLSAQEEDKAAAQPPWVSFAASLREEKTPGDDDRSFFELVVTYPWEERLLSGSSEKPSVSMLGCEPTVTGHIVGLGSLESSFLVRNVASITDFNHPDLPALRLAISYLTQTEGPMWRKIRGKGLAYGYGLSLSLDEGVLSFSLDEASQLVDAYVEAIDILKSHVVADDDDDDGRNESSWDQLLFESAKSCLIYDLIEKEAEICDVVQQSLYALYRRLPHDYNRLFLNRLDEVTFDEMVLAARKHLGPLVDPSVGTLVAVCPSSKTKIFQNKFKKCGHRLGITPPLEKSRFSE